MEAPVALDDALAAFLAGLEHVHGTRRVRDAVRAGHVDDWLGDKWDPEPITVLAIGKAAPAMVWGLVEANVPFSGIGVAAAGTPLPAAGGIEWLVGEHPAPGAGSRQAARRLRDWLPQQRRLLVLLSGGASSLVDDSDADAWTAELRKGLSIGELNARRAERCDLKAGGMARLCPDARVWLLQDAPDPEVVGSGPFQGAPHVALATSNDLIEAVAANLGQPCYRAPDLTGTTADALERFLAMAVPPGSVLIAGGETHDAMPPDAPPGSRCTHAAAMASERLAPGQTFLALASDGQDGAGKTGAWATHGDDGVEAAARSAGLAWAEANDRIIDLGRSGTNVNDVWMLLT